MKVYLQSMKSKSTSAFDNGKHMSFVKERVHGKVANLLLSWLLDVALHLNALIVSFFLITL